MGSVSGLNGPGVRLEVVQNGIEGEFTLTDGDQEALDGGIVTLIERVARQGKPQLVLDLTPGHFLVTAEHVGFRTVRKTKLVDHCHLSVGNQPYHRVLGDEIQRLLERIF